LTGVEWGAGLHVKGSNVSRNPGKLHSKGKLY
jgi:hypothetical protein